jgi:hypothetical protein
MINPRYPIERGSPYWETIEGPPEHAVRFLARYALRHYQPTERRMRGWPNCDQSHTGPHNCFCQRCKQLRRRWQKRVCLSPPMPGPFILEGPPDHVANLEDPPPVEIAQGYCRAQRDVVIGEWVWPVNADVEPNAFEGPGLGPETSQAWQAFKMDGPWAWPRVRAEPWFLDGPPNYPACISCRTIKQPLYCIPGRRLRAQGNWSWICNDCTERHFGHRW